MRINRINSKQKSIWMDKTLSHAPAWALILYDNHKGRHHPATRPPRNNKPERVPMCLAQFRKRAKPRNQNGSCNVSSLRGPAARSVHACRHAAPIAATSGVKTAPRCPLRKAPPLFDRGTALKMRHPRRGARGRKGSPKLAASLVSLVLGLPPLSAPDDAPRPDRPPNPARRGDLPQPPRRDVRVELRPE